MVELYTNILINAKLQIGKRSKNRADWEKPIEEAKVAWESSAI
jgi:hypothetical protein